ncbi:MAG: hypothetical protein LBU32_20565 [Clostridiales bacterium]|nr:hypothetical protein [Clostridiales bacterium]
MRPAEIGGRAWNDGSRSWPGLLMAGPAVFGAVGAIMSSELDRWMRRRLRECILKRWEKLKARRKN